MSSRRFDDFLKEMKEEREAFEKKFFLYRWIVNAWNFFWYRVLSTNWIYSFKWNIQRIFRGYSDCDVWGVNTFTVEKLQPVIKAYVTYEAEQGHSLPAEFSTDPAKWLEILRDIEYAFDWLWNEDFGEPYKSDTEENSKKHHERVDRGCELFGRHFRTMWD